ncbi:MULTISPECIES: CapA family protein [unclassified Rhizobium]|uniref:CapA family protein n=1 Tax=unclassified Rhizobium TaxID=2613769 RepID=UPI001618AB23|nr:MULTISPECIES: CapA family protein [unclassified Rhizobium]MBB3386234.1 poly-gamma-glutamate synthesis protein (capsule biosynthesis protein) [Rhizobium sp. BK098]MBB3571754.1 poly-gamma-glutamate synthesis protein (capsule biosynthesis protein) [Rhizobium sp. BK491]MBB3617938.1 poly-gamma-glutamate synthesis protein (capsule biosynthesis protein) [Rhizobium sp. BK609]MBB3683609.1 poly-gamma-glutamate synthesis protein (capsule biosynthesis protein) [Rhizobium sp. BK612]
MSAPFSIALTGQSLIRHDLRSISDPQLDEIAQILKASDVAFTNLETTIYSRHGGWPLKGSYFGAAAPEVLPALKELGFNSLALANNHAFDLGPSGILSTLEEVAAQNFLHAGIGVDQRHAAKPGKKTFGSRNVALIAIDAGPGPSFMYAEDASEGRMARPGINRLKVSRVFDVEVETFNVLRSIQRRFLSSNLERANYAQPEDPPEVNDKTEIDFYGTMFHRADRNVRRIVIDRHSAWAQLSTIVEEANDGTFVIVYLHHHHWEPSWQQVPSWVREFAHHCVNAGAGLFVSHGAPVLQAIEIYRDTPIFYGLGNFLFHTEKEEQEWSPPEVWKSVVATCNYGPGGRLRDISVRPIVIGGIEALSDRDRGRLPFPVLVDGKMAEEILKDLAVRSAGFDTILSQDNGIGRIVL